MYANKFTNTLFDIKPISGIASTYDVLYNCAIIVNF